MSTIDERYANLKAKSDKLIEKSKLNRAKEKNAVRRLMYGPEIKTICNWKQFYEAKGKVNFTEQEIVLIIKGNYKFSSKFLEPWFDKSGLV